MGAVDDPMSVCDEEGSVIGVQGLRVGSQAVLIYMPTVACDL